MLLVFLYLRIQYLEKAKGPRLGAPVATELCYPQTYKLQMRPRGVQFKVELDRRLPYTLICILLSSLQWNVATGVYFLPQNNTPTSPHLSRKGSAALTLTMSACYLVFDNEDGVTVFSIAYLKSQKPGIILFGTSFLLYL
jgi:hypothetical protein